MTERRRWLQLSAAALGIRYRGIEAPGTQGGTSQLQVTHAVRGMVGLDPNGRIGVHFGIASGRGFSGGWNTTGVGTGGATYDVAVKQLLGSVRVSNRLTLEAGGLYFSRGQSTEATSYDNDGYLVGERLIIRHPVTHLFDDVSLTRAFLGDFNRANVFARLDTLNRANYYQVLVQKRLRRVAASTDYAAYAHTHIVRSALVTDPSARLHSRFRFEQYARLNGPRGYGFAVMAQRTVGSSIMTAAGVSSIDPRYGPLNGDLYGRGRRLFGSISRRFGGAWLASAQVARAVGPVTSPAIRTRVDVALAYDARRAWTLAHR